MKRSEKLLSRDQSVLVVVDMQPTFLAPIQGREFVEKTVALMMKAASILKLPVLATLQYAERMGGMTEELTALLPEGCEPVDKLCFSCLGQETFALQLQSLKRNQVVLVGIETHICVLQTALDLTCAGYKVFVPWDAVHARSEYDTDYALDRMRAAGVTITGVESVIYEWLYEAGTEDFKKILPLVKER